MMPIIVNGMGLPVPCVYQTVLDELEVNPVSDVEGILLVNSLYYEVVAS